MKTFYISLEDRIFFKKEFENISQVFCMAYYKVEGDIVDSLDNIVCLIDECIDDIINKPYLTTDDVRYMRDTIIWHIDNLPFNDFPI